MAPLHKSVRNKNSLVVLVCAGEKNRSQVQIKDLTRYPASALSFFALLQNSHGPPAFDSSHKLLMTTAETLTRIRLVICAGEKNRTPDYWLEASRFTTKLHPQMREWIEKFTFLFIFRMQRLQGLFYTRK